MVTREEFQRVQRLLGREGHIQPQKMRWAFTGLIRCGLCGGAVTAERKVKHYEVSGLQREYVYYHCCGRDCRPKTSVEENVLEAEIDGLLKRCRLDQDFSEWCILNCEKASARGEEAAQGQAIQALAQARQRRERLFEMRAGGEIGKEEFMARSARADQEIIDLGAAIQEAVSRAERDREAVTNLLHFCATAYNRLTQGDVQAKREVEFALVGRLSLTLGKLEIQPHPLLDLIRRIEPAEIGSDKQKEDTLAPPSPTWWAMRDDIRTVLGKSDSMHHFFKLS